MIRRALIRGALIFCWLTLASDAARAQEPPRRLFAGGLFGVSTLSADGRSITSGSDAAISLYKPENGLALNLFAGYHTHRFFSLQANYMWNRNELTLLSSFVASQGGGFYEQQRRSAQHIFVADTLVYFRRLGSSIRPYLGTGLCVVGFTSTDIRRTVSTHVIDPPGDITDTGIALRSHVGIDVKLSPRVSFRYSFSEIIGRNPVSQHLTPRGERRLANFENLFGFVMHF
jgi:outer membrane protein W